jgi:hypothetical protein
MEALRVVLDWVRGDGRSPGAPAQGGAADRRATALGLAVLCLGILMRFVSLGADPRYYAWAGHITDEGRWIQQAREVALFGAPDLDYWLAMVHLMVAPLFQAASWLSFSLFGVGFTSARLVSAVAGSCLLVAVWVFLRSRTSTRGAILALALVAFQRDLIFLSRVAIPEMSSTLFAFLAFTMLVAGPRSSGRAFLGGLLTAVGLGFKGTNLPIVVVMVAVIVATHQEGDPAGRFRRTGSYLAAVVGSAALVVVFAGLAGIGVMGRFANIWPALREFTQLSPSYDAATFLFRGEHSVSINAYLLGAWLVAGALLVAGRAPRGTPGAIYVGSAVWASGWLMLAAVLDYFPARYIFHALVPLSVNVGAGWSLLGARDASAQADGDSPPPRSRRVLGLVWLAAPAAVMLAPAVTGLLGYAGVPVSRFSIMSASIVALVLISIPLVLRFARLDGAVAFLSTFGVASLVVWLLAFHWGVAARFWPDAGALDPLVVVIAAAVATAVVAGGLFRARSAARAATFQATPIAVGMAAIAILGMVQSLPPIVSPSYTLAEAGRELDTLLADRDGVWTNRAASVFLGTGLKYHEGYEFEATPYAIVDMFNPIPERLEPDFLLEREFRIDLGWEFTRGSDIEPTIRLYRRRTSS